LKNTNPDPAARSRTVLETRISPGSAADSTLDVEAEPPDGVADGKGALGCAGRGVEGCEETITHRFDLVALVEFQGTDLLETRQRVKARVRYAPPNLLV
jgi:hypothetical protein